MITLTLFVIGLITPVSILGITIYTAKEMNELEQQEIEFNNSRK